MQSMLLSPEVKKDLSAKRTILEAQVKEAVSQLVVSDIPEGGEELQLTLDMSNDEMSSAPRPLDSDDVEDEKEDEDEFHIRPSLIRSASRSGSGSMSPSGVRASLLSPGLSGVRASLMRGSLRQSFSPRMTRKPRADDYEKIQLIGLDLLFCIV